MNQVRKCSPGLISNIWRLSERSRFIVDPSAILLPHAERDPKFREYMRRLSHPGLVTLALVEIAAPILLHFGRLAVGNNVPHLWQTGLMVLAGALTLAISATPWSRLHARLIAVLSAWSAPAAIMIASRATVATDDYVLTGITVVVLTAVATVPLLPWHTLAIGLSVEAMYIFTSRSALFITSAHSDAHHIFLILLILLATGVSASNYEHRRAEYEASQEAVRAAEALTGAQLRAQLAENAISIGKMAAALSHELNSPLGALRSSVDTLVALTDRQLEAAPEQRDKLAEMRAELKRAIDESAGRIDEVTRRLRRFVGLEEGELKSADLNELLSDVALLHREELENGHIRLGLELEKGLPPLRCRPQLLTAAFSALLSNAIDAVNGNGRIEIETRGQGSEVQVTIRDNGRGMSPQEVDTIFDPSFKISGGRISSGNWSLFNSRQIVYEHGGDISVETAQGEGTSIHVVLPLNVG